MKYLFSLLILSSLHSFAQPDPLGDFNKYMAANWKGEYYKIGPYKVKGSPYLFGDAFPGSINYKSGQIAKDKMIYFDIYNYKVETLEKNTRYETIDTIEEFSLLLSEQFGGRESKFRNANAFGKTAPKGFFNILEDGKRLCLLKYFKINLMADPVNQMDKEARIFEQVYEYYIYNKTSNELRKIKLKEKDITKMLNNKKFIDEVIRAKKIDLNNEASVINALVLYNNY